MIRRVPQRQVGRMMKIHPLDCGRLGEGLMAGVSDYHRYHHLSQPSHVSNGVSKCLWEERPSMTTTHIQSGHVVERSSIHLRKSLRKWLRRSMHPSQMEGVYVPMGVDTAAFGMSVLFLDLPSNLDKPFLDALRDESLPDVDLEDLMRVLDDATSESTIKTILRMTTDSSMVRTRYRSVARLRDRDRAHSVVSKVRYQACASSWKGLAHRRKFCRPDDVRHPDRS